MRVSRTALFPYLLFCLLATSVKPVKADTVLNFSDVAPGTLTVFSPYVSQGYTLSSSAGGFVFNSPDTGNGSPQSVGNNPFYAGANALSSFSPATITLVRTDSAPFSLTSIDLARNFAFDPAPTVTFTGTLNGGGTVTQTFTVTTASPPLAFQTFNFTGFNNLSSVSWSQGVPTGNLHQFTNIHVDAATAPEPASLALTLWVSALAVGVVARRCRLSA